MIPVIIALWALGVVAVLWVIFRGLFPKHPLRAILLWVFGLIGLVASILVQGAFVSQGYGAFLPTLAAAGPPIAIGAAIVLALDLAMLVTYTLCYGRHDIPKGTVTKDGPMTMGLGPAFGRSKKKILVSRHEDISMESLLGGTATPGERMMAIGICVLYVAFPAIFVGGGLTMIDSSVLLGALFALAPAVWAYQVFFKPVWHAYHATKVKLGRRAPGGSL